MKKPNSPEYILFLLLSFAFCAQAQNDLAKARIEGIGKPGYHKILLPPEYQEHAANDFRNIRIMTDSLKEIPYFIQRESRKDNGNQLFYQSFDTTTYTIKSTPAGSTEVIIRNRHSRKEDHFAFGIKNSEIHKEWLLSGSDDGKNWYAITGNKTFGHYQYSTFPAYKTVNFSPVNYVFYKVTIHDSTYQPYKILSVGKLYPMQVLSSVKTLPVHLFKMDIYENKDTKKTIIQFDNSYPVNVSSVIFNISEAGLFRRDAELLYQPLDARNWISHAQFTIESRADSVLRFDIPEIYTSHMRIEISNQDNAPLNIRDIVFYQKPVYLVSDLKLGHDYYCIFKDMTVEKPAYDLEYFQDRIPDSLPELSLGPLIEIARPASVIKPLSFWEQKWFMWCCIGVGALIISGISIMLLKDLRHDSNTSP